MPQYSNPSAQSIPVDTGTPIKNIRKLLFPLLQQNIWCSPIFKTVSPVWFFLTCPDISRCHKWQYDKCSIDLPCDKPGNCVKWIKGTTCVKYKLHHLFQTCSGGTWHKEQLVQSYFFYRNRVDFQPLRSNISLSSRCWRQSAGVHLSSCQILSHLRHLAGHRWKQNAELDGPLVWFHKATLLVLKKLITHCVCVLDFQCSITKWS